MPPDISESDYQWWVELISELVETEAFAIAVKERGLQPYIKIGAEYETMVTQEVKEFRELAKEVGLIPSGDNVESQIETLKLLRVLIEKQLKIREENI